MEPLQPGDPSRISTYQLLSRLGAGGMGQVFLGRSPSGRQVAVKVIRPELTNDQEFRTRFRREVVAMKQVSGFFTAPVVDADPDGSPAWLATAYVQGPSLAEAVRDRGPMPQNDVLVLAAGLAEALVAIHKEGLTHRDLKPANVLLAEDGPRVIDFGLAVTAHSSVVTQAGMVVGTPSFMSPEQINGQGVGPASDVFSLGAVLVYAATGRAPHGEGGTMELMYRVVNNEPDLNGISGTLLQLVTACLSKDPAQRPTPVRILEVLSEGAGVQATSARGWTPPQVALHQPGQPAQPQYQGPNSGPQPVPGPHNTFPDSGARYPVQQGQHMPGPGPVAAPHHNSGPQPTVPSYGIPAAQQNSFPPYGPGPNSGGQPMIGYGGAKPANKTKVYAIAGAAVAVVAIAGVAIAASGGGSSSSSTPANQVALPTADPSTAPAQNTTTTASSASTGPTGSSDSGKTPADKDMSKVNVESLFTMDDAATYLKAAKSDINDEPQAPDDNSSSKTTAHGWSVKDGTATDNTFLNSILVQSTMSKDNFGESGVKGSDLFYASQTKPLPSDPPFNPVTLAGADKAAIQVRSADGDLAKDQLQKGMLVIERGNMVITVSFSEMKVTPDTCARDLQGLGSTLAGRLPK